MRVRLETYALAKGRGRAGGARGWARPLRPARAAGTGLGDGVLPGPVLPRARRGRRSGHRDRRGARSARRPTRGRPPRPAHAGGLSKSATKAPTEPERTRRNVDIPRFHSRPISPRGAFVADLDTPPPRGTTGAPPAPHPRSPIPLTTLTRTHGPPFPARKAHYPGPAPARTPLTHSLPHHRVDPWLWAAGSGEIDLNASSARQNPPQLARCELSSTKSTSARFVRAHLAQCELR